MTTRELIEAVPEKARTYDCTSGNAVYCYGCYTMTHDKDGYGDWVSVNDHNALVTACKAVLDEIIIGCEYCTQGRLVGSRDGRLAMVECKHCANARALREKLR